MSARAVGTVGQVAVGNRVREARERAGLTQIQLASACRVTRQTIGLLEAGKYNPTLRLALLIARSLGRSLDTLFWLEEREP